MYEFIDGTGIDLEQWAVPDLPDLDLDSWLDKFMRDPAALGDPEAVPEEPTTQRGNLWVLGDHRVLCGDATSVDDVEKLMDGEVATLMVTDPPYGVEYDPEWRKEAGSTKTMQRWARFKTTTEPIGQRRGQSALPWWHMSGTRVDMPVWFKAV